MKSILVVSFSDLANDPRVYRQLEFLKSDYGLSALGYSAPGVAGVTYFPCRRPQKSFFRRAVNALELKLGLSEAYYWNRAIRGLATSFAGNAFDLVIANELNTLPLAFRIAAGRPVLFDAHEYAPREFEDDPLWKFFYTRYLVKICSCYLPRCAAMTTVSEGIAAEYRRNFGASPVVVTNATHYHDLDPVPPEPDKIKMIHHGAAIPARKLEGMIRLMGFLDDRFSLDFMLTAGDARYIGRLQEMAQSDPRIRFPAPGPMRGIPARINGYDIGLFLLPPTNFNYAHALPNKFFEFIQARLAVAVGPTPEMAAIVARHDCGIVAADFTPRSLAAALNALTPERILRFKENADQAATVYCAENSAEILRGVIDGLLAG